MGRQEPGNSPIGKPCGPQVSLQPGSVPAVTANKKEEVWPERVQKRGKVLPAFLRAYASDETNDLRPLGNVEVPSEVADNCGTRGSSEFTFIDCVRYHDKAR